MSEIPSQHSLKMALMKFQVESHTMNLALTVWKTQTHY